MIRKVKVLLLFISLSICLSIMSNTYSRYVATTTGDLTAAFSKWQILVNTDDITKETNTSFALLPHIENNDNVADDVIAPSSKGYFDINIDPTNVNVSFKYKIDLEIENEDIPDLVIVKYFILPDGYTEGEEVEVRYLNSDNEINDYLLFQKNEKDFEFKPFTVRVYFEWLSDTTRVMDDEDDTQIGLLAAEEDLTLQMKANISFEQIIN